MKLKLNDKYAITSDTNCYMLNNILVNKKTNEEYLQPFAFYNTLASLILGLINREIRQCDLRDVDKIIAHINVVKDEILKEVSKHENK